MATDKSSPSRYHRPPLESFPATVDFLGHHGFTQEEFADWLVSAGEVTMLSFGQADEVHAVAELFVRVRNEPESLPELSAGMATEPCIRKARGPMPRPGDAASIAAALLRRAKSQR